MCIRCCYLSSVQFSLSVLSLCDPVDCMPGFPVHHKLLKLTQAHVHWVSDAMQLSGEFVISLVCLTASKIWRDSSVLFGKQRKIHPLSMRLSQPKKHEEKRGTWLSLAPLFMCFFLLPLSLAYVNWASQEGGLFYLRFSFQSSELPLFNFMGFFLPCLLAATILDSFFLFYLTKPLSMWKWSVFTVTYFF